MLDNLRKYHVLLASKSPRRRELLQQLRIPFDVVSIGGIEEKYPDTLRAEEVPQYLSNLKAEVYSEKLRHNELIITADTVVMVDGEILGKPSGYDDAYDMLMHLSGRTHLVVTGVTITTREKKCSFTTKTEVKFAELTDEEVRFYIDNYSPMDKAGAYGIQEWIGCVAVESITGSFYNVMGLPVHRLYEELKQF